MRALVLALVLMAVATGARAADFLVRTAGAGTALAVDREAIRTSGKITAAWTYELFWEKGRGKPRTQILAVMQVVNCKTKIERALATAQYDAAGHLLSRSGRDAGWTLTLHGSNTDYLIDLLCGRPDGAWASSPAKTVFEAYRLIWKRQLGPRP
jgi:hypothetical protein